MRHDLAALPVLDLAAAIASGDLRAVEALEAFEARARSANEATRAVVHWQGQAAREAAAAMDAAPTSAALPLRGVPFTVKEALPLTGAPHTSGSVYRRHVVAGADMSAVANLRRAGAVPFASTNMSEMGAQWESVNTVYGRSHNPHDLSRTPGGSSGGCGALVAVGGTGFSVGADTGGSIRIPAAFCGVFGHKGTRLAVDIDGHVPPLHGNLAGYCSIGPLTRRAADLWPLFQIMAGVLPHELAQRDAAAAVEGCRVLLVEGLARPASRASRECVAAVARAGDALSAAGGETRWVPPRRLGNAFMMWTSLAKSDGSADFANEVTDGDPARLSLRRQLLASARGRGDHTSWSMVTLLSERYLEPLLRPAYPRYVRAVDAVRGWLLEALGERGVLVMPVHPRVAFRHGGTHRRPLDFAYAGLFNALGFPATAVPAGRDRAGLPLSVQVVGAPGADALTTAVAEVLEPALGGWVRPRRFTH